jgi:hypothetical protein
MTPEDAQARTMTPTTRGIIENSIRAAIDGAILDGADPADVLAILQGLTEDEANFQADLAEGGAA